MADTPIGALVANPTQTMSSLEIAGLVESRHDSVKRAIERLAERGVISLPPMVEVSSQRERRLETTSAYSVCKRDSYIVVAQLCPEFTARLVDRWQELEAQSAPVHQSLPNFANPVAAARAWADEVEAKQKAEASLALAAPKVEFVERYVEATGLKRFRDVAKLLSINEREFREFLTSERIMYQLGGSWVAYQPHIDAGRFSVKTGVSEVNNHAYNSCLFTPKGVAWIAGLLASKRAARAVLAEVAA